MSAGVVDKSVSKSDLFTVNTVFQRPPRTCLLTCLDHRVGDIALKIFGGLGITAAVAVAITTTLVIGWGVIPIVIVVTLAGVGCVSFYVRSHLKRYHNHHRAEHYRVQAKNLYQEMKSVDATSFLKGKDLVEQRWIKQHLLRPLKSLKEIHGSFNTIFKYKIIKPEDFNELFQFEIKYLDFPEAFKLYKEIRVAAEKQNYDLDTYAPSWKEEWREKLTNYVEEQSNSVFMEGEVDDMYRVLMETTQMIDACLTNKILDDTKKEELNRIKDLVQKEQKDYDDLAKACSAIEKLDKAKRDRIERYQRDYGHAVIYAEQQSVLKEIAKIRGVQDATIQDINRAYNMTHNAIQLRGVLNQEGAPHNPDDLREVEFYKEKFSQEQERVNCAYSNIVEEYMTQKIPNVYGFSGVLQRLKTIQQDCEKRYEKKAEESKRSIEDFRTSEQILAFKVKFITYYTAYKRALLNEEAH